MSDRSLKHLTIKHLRGSVEPFTLEFEKGKRLTVIYGENGAGKSTICDSLEFLANGKVGSIEDRGLGKTPPYWVSLGKNSEDISVELVCGDGPCHARMNKSSVVVSPPNSQPKVEILRRSQILKLIEASPAKRYEEISRFIDVSSIEASEKNLVRLVKDLKADEKVAIALTQESLENIENFYSSSGLKNGTALPWAKGETSRDMGVFDRELAALNNLSSSYGAITQRLESVQRADSSFKLAEQAFSDASRQLNAVDSRASEGSSDLLELWKTAHSFLQNHSTDTVCPLCESAENAEGLQHKVAERINQLSNLNRAVERKNSAEAALHRAQQQLQVVRETLQTAARQFQSYCLAEALPNDVQLPRDKVPSDARALSAWLENTSGLPTHWNQLEAQRQDTKQFISALRKSLKNYDENVQQQQSLAGLIPQLERALEISADERRKFTDELLAIIADEVGRLYEIIHPGEGKNKISLELNPKKRASLDIKTEFCGQSDIQPQAYFSESHLDTLGLCVFLALSGLDTPDDTILVLDDVLASVDEPHVERLMNLLHSEAQRFRHCVITTHYRPWKYKLRWGQLQSGKYHFVELTRWSLAKGLTQIRSIPEVERLRMLLTETSTPDLQSICGKAGVILEAMLEFLTRKYGCMVPRREGDERYTLGDLLPAVDKKLRKALRVEILQDADEDGKQTYASVDLKELIEKIDTIAQARNIFGAHFNTLSFELLDDDALDFGLAVLELADILIDPDNGWPRHNKSGSYWETSGDTRRLHPLQKPRK